MNVLAQSLKQKGVQELRFLFCPTNKASEGVRQFLKENYAPLKEAYPRLPILIREAEGTTPTVIARFKYNQELGAMLVDRPADKIAPTISDILARASK